MHAASQETKIIRHSASVAAGVTTITPSAGVDMKGYDSALFVAEFGAIVAGAATSIKVQQSSDDGATDAYSDLAGTSVTVPDTGDNQVFYVEVVRPAKRYLKMSVSRAAQNATLDSILCVLSNPKKVPTTHDATVGGGETWVTPAEGTA